MLIYYDKTPGGVDIIWNDDEGYFTSIRPESNATYSETKVLEVTHVDYEMIQYIEAHLDTKSAMDFALSVKDSMTEEQYEKLTKIIATSQNQLRYKIEK